MRNKNLYQSLPLFASSATAVAYIQSHPPIWAIAKKYFDIDSQRWESFVYGLSNFIENTLSPLFSIILVFLPSTLVSLKEYNQITFFNLKTQKTPLIAMLNQLSMFLYFRGNANSFKTNVWPNHKKVTFLWLYCWRSNRNQFIWRNLWSQSKSKSWSLKNKNLEMDVLWSQSKSWPPLQDSASLTVWVDPSVAKYEF